MGGAGGKDAYAAGYTHGAARSPNVRHVSLRVVLMCSTRLYCPDATPSRLVNSRSVDYGPLKIPTRTLKTSNNPAF
eukprot:467055-Prorocentrum_minimum.AAC.1